MAFERVQAAAPELSIGGEPPIHVGERLGPQPVEASLTVGTHADEAGVTEDAQVLRHPGLADLEPVDQLSNGPFALAEEVKDAPALRLGEDVEGGVHGGEDYYTVICLPSDIAPRMRCESGKDGSSVFVRGTKLIRVRP